MIYANGIPIVGAMAVSPDLLPITAICIGLTMGRTRLVGRAMWTDLLPANFESARARCTG